MTGYDYAYNYSYSYTCLPYPPPRYLCRRCTARYSSPEAVGEHARLVHQVWDCGDFTVKVVPA